MQGGTSAVGSQPKNWSLTQGIRRSVRLLQGFHRMDEDPSGFAAMLADDAVCVVHQFHPLGSCVVDVGGGAGYLAEAFRRAGAPSAFVEPLWVAMSDRGKELGYGVIGDGLSLPLGEATFDISHSSNGLEHVIDPRRFPDEMVRVVVPGGVVFLAFTNWFTPFGGHETSPWHFSVASVPRCATSKEKVQARELLWLDSVSP